MVYAVSACHLSGVDRRTGRAYTQNFKSVRAGIWSAGGSVPDALPWTFVSGGVHWSVCCQCAVTSAGSMEAGCCWWRRCKINGSRWEFIWCKWNLASVFYWHFAGRNLDNRDAFVQKGETEVEYPAWPVSECGNADFFVLVFLKVMVYNKKMKCELKNWRNMIC